MSKLWSDSRLVEGLLAHGGGTGKKEQRRAWLAVVGMDSFGGVDVDLFMLQL